MGRPDYIFKNRMHDEYIKWCKSMAHIIFPLERNRAKWESFMHFDQHFNSKFAPFILHIDWKFARLCGKRVHLHKHAAPTCSFFKRNDGWCKHAENCLENQYISLRLGCRKCVAQRTFPQVNKTGKFHQFNRFSISSHFPYRSTSGIMFRLILI